MRFFFVTFTQFKHGLPLDLNEATALLSFTKKQRNSWKDIMALCRTSRFTLYPVHTRSRLSLFVTFPHSLLINFFLSKWRQQIFSYVTEAKNITCQSFPFAWIFSLLQKDFLFWVKAESFARPFSRHSYREKALLCVLLCKWANISDFFSNGWIAKKYGIRRASVLEKSF